MRYGGAVAYKVKDELKHDNRKRREQFLATCEGRLVKSWTLLNFSLPSMLMLELDYRAIVFP